MQKAKKNMKEITEDIGISEDLYHEFLKTYENSITKETKQEKDIINNNQNGRSVWLSNKINSWMVVRK
jgi:hypothetical protein